MIFHNLEVLEKNHQTEFGGPVKKREEDKYRPPSQPQKLHKIPSAVITDANSKMERQIGGNVDEIG